MKEEGEERENKDRRESKTKRQEIKSEREGPQSGGRDSVPSYRSITSSC